MRFRVPALLLLALTAWAANIKLYLKDGDYQLAREYQVLADRVRFYSVERSQWEEIPLDLVDLKRTQAEQSERKADLEQETKMVAEEEAAERAVQKEVSQIPRDAGVYWRENDQTKVLRQAESTVHTNKGRSILKRLAPVPLVTGKATLELNGAASETVFENPTPEFYIQLSDPERFGIVKVKTKGALRIVEDITFMPVTNEVIEEPEEIPILQRQLDDGLYKIWPKEPLPSGQYAVVQYTQGKLNMQVWDFAVKAKR